MKYVICRLPYKYAYLIVIGDLHIGDRGFGEESKEKLRGYLEWVRDRPNARVFLNGDLLNCATRVSATSPFDQDMPLKEQIEMVVNYLKPIKKKIIGAIDGNHEQRLSDYCGYSPTISICDRLGFPYFGDSAVVNFQVGIHKRGSGRENARISYLGYFHHTTGGGATVGGKINRVDKMRQLVINCDFYCGSHNHMLGAVPVAVPYVDRINGCIVLLKQFLIDCGGYLEWSDSYAERKQLPPQKIGSPRIRLDGTFKKDLHVSL